MSKIIEAYDIATEAAAMVAHAAAAETAAHRAVTDPDRETSRGHAVAALDAAQAAKRAALEVYRLARIVRAYAAANEGDPFAEEYAAATAAPITLKTEDIIA